MQYEICRTTRKNIIRFDNDTKACYDRIIAGMSNVCSRSLGLHQDVAILNGQTLEQMKHHMKTKDSITGDFYQHTPPDQPVYGTAQGAANSPGHWIGVSSLLFDCHAKRATGATFSSPDTLTTTRLSMIGYVDDSIISTLRDNRNGIETITKAAEQDAELWNALLTNSGGKFNGSKCSWHLLSYKFCELGHPHQVSRHTLPAINVTDHKTKRILPIKQLLPSQAHKTLVC